MAFIRMVVNVFYQNYHCWIESYALNPLIPIFLPQND